MRLVSLASGSKGNAFLVQANGTSVLIDAGLSGRDLENRLQAVGVLPSQINLLLLTHEHADHIRSAAMLSRRHEFVVAGTRGTLHTPCGTVKPVASGTFRLEIMPAGATLTVGPFTVTSFSVSHDAADPVGYAIRANGTRLVFAFDLGIVTPEVQAQLADAEALVLESNHCPVMLQNGPYPAWLKRRVAGARGHLSNQQAGETVRQAYHAGLRYLLLAHLSENNNTPRAAFDNMNATLAELNATTDLRVCRQHQTGNWIDLED